MMRDDTLSMICKGRRRACLFSSEGRLWASAANHWMKEAAWKMECATGAGRRLDGSRTLPGHGSLPLGDSSVTA